MPPDMKRVKRFGGSTVATVSEWYTHTHTHTYEKRAL